MVHPGCIGTPLQTPLAGVYRSPCTAPAREGIGSAPCGGASECGAEMDNLLEAKPERVEFLRVRSLRTQQRAESQCQVITPCRVSSDVWWGFLWLIDIKSASSWFSAAIKSSTESLILAQDERWRRA